jgi:hypothetical protein
MGYEDCYCASYPNPYRASLADTTDLPPLPESPATPYPELNLQVLLERQIIWIDEAKRVLQDQMDALREIL